MKLHSRTKTTIAKNKRLGRGYGSGKGGHTAGRGQKGQKTRGKVPAHFIGTSWVWFKRLPFMRGKSRFNSLSPRLTLTLSQLSSFKSGATVSKATLYEQGLITKTNFLTGQVKLVASGEITKKLNVQIPATQSAISAIEKAGGSYSGQKTE